jgi:RimJ/RimL family protein N-acetyltransferase
LADGVRAGFGAVNEHGTFLGLGLAVYLNDEEVEPELGDTVAPSARGAGVAQRILALLTEWAFRERGIIRSTLVINVVNAASQQVARRCGYVLEGVMRPVYSRPGRRADAGLWSRLTSDPRFEHGAGRLLNMMCRYEGSESCSRTARASAASL